MAQTGRGGTWTPEDEAKRVKAREDAQRRKQAEIVKLPEQEGLGQLAARQPVRGRAHDIDLSKTGYAPSIESLLLKRLLRHENE